MKYWIWLAEGLGYGAQNSGELLSVYPGGAKQIFGQLHTLPLRALLKQKQYEKLSISKPQDYISLIERIKANGVSPLAYADKSYPELLRQTNAPPPVLYVKGDVQLLNGCFGVAVVGTRRPSVYGIDATQYLGRGLAKSGVVLISGLAAGLDSEAHKAALAEKAPTIACIAFGHDMCYPASNRSLMKVIEQKGAVVSEYPIGAGCEKTYFLHRNRIIAGISNALLVVEARDKSGTMSTVNFAVEYGREVFAVPGSILSELSRGTNSLIIEGARLASNVENILDVCLNPAGNHNGRLFDEKTAKDTEDATEKTQRQISFLNTDDTLKYESEEAREYKEDKKNDFFEEDLRAEETYGASENEEAGHAEAFVKQAARKALPTELSADKQLVFSAISTQHRTLDDICAKVKLPPSKVMSALTQLEMEGFISQLAGRQFCVKE